MARTKEIVRRYGGGHVRELVTERTTLRMDLPDGGCLRSDGRNFWIRNKAAGWYGSAPDDWDGSRAVPDVYERGYEFDADYS